MEQPELEYTLVSDEPISDSLERRSAADRIGFYLSIDDDFEQFYAIASQDKAFAPVLERLYGHHQVKFITPFETAAWAVLSQRNPMAMARKVKDKVAAEYGGRITVGDAILTRFPGGRSAGLARLRTRFLPSQRTRSALSICEPWLVPSRAPTKISSGMARTRRWRHGCAASRA